tara:strand:- start:119 stop:292 length:174 start_codon:yes stop_codon:yes gene_type:complete
LIIDRQRICEVRDPMEHERWLRRERHPAQRERSRACAQRNGRNRERQRARDATSAED